MALSVVCCKDKETIKPRKSLFLTSLSFLLCFGAYQGVLALESSINVEEGLGTTSVLVTFIISSISCITLVPNMIDFLGAKSAITIGLVGFAAYIAANFYPSWYTLIPAAIFHGLTESAPWAGSSVYINFLGEELWKLQNPDGKQKSKQYFVYKSFGIYYSFLYAGNIVGNGVTTLILRLFMDRDSSSNFQHFQENGQNVTSSTGQTTALTSAAVNPENQLKNCGAADCQATYIYNGTSENLEKFKPSPISIYVLLGIFMTMSTLGIMLQAFFTIRAPPKFELNKNHEEELESLSIKDKKEPSTKIQLLRNLRSQVQAIVTHLFCPQHLFILSLYVYYGLSYGYFLTEYTRAYVSCTVGVEELGLTLMLFSVCVMVFSIPASRIVLHLGRVRYAFLVGAIHLSVYLLSLLWVPTESNLWVVYMIAIIGGMGEAFILSLAQGMVAVYFKKDKLGIAYSVNNLTTNLGIVAATGSSISLCVYTRLYIQIGCLAFAVCSLVGADLFYSKTKKKKQKRRTSSRSNSPLNSLSRISLNGIST